MASSALVFFSPPVDRHELQTSFCYANSYPKRVTTALVIGSVFLGTSGCGSDPVAPGPDPDFMVGDWLHGDLGGVRAPLWRGEIDFDLDGTSEAGALRRVLIPK